MGYSQEVTLTLTTDATTTPILTIAGAVRGTVDLPSTASLTLLEFYGSNDGTTFSIIDDDSGEPLQLALTASEARSKKLPDECFGRRYLRVKAAAAVTVVFTFHFD